MRLKALLVIAAVIAWCGGVSSPIDAVAAHPAELGHRKGQIHAVLAWARVNPVQGRPVAVFFTLHNESGIADALIKVSTPIAKRAEVHNSKSSQGGIMKMMPSPSVAVAAEDLILFEPGSYHVMLFDLVRIPKIGSQFPLTLTFAKGKPQTILVAAKGLSNAPPPHNAGHH
jgi:periplasmic copper chaperone A